MFRVDRTDNRLVRLEEKRFGDLNISERNHFQEWLVGSPDSLGEELLIIQKEFDGFKDTRERLDLLALDTDGRLVVIENKLDDSGRDVVWQALKYVAYCSTLNKAKLIEIYQDYLDRWDKGADATKKLREFLDPRDLDEMVLNGGNDQRLVLIAKNFRKEVTATALWLIGHEIKVQCFQAKLYGYGDQLFIDFQQIIPAPDAEDYMIGMVDKETEEKSAQRKKRDREELLLEFWSQTLEKLHDLGNTRFANISPSKESGLWSATGISSCVLTLNLLRKTARVELYLTRPQKEENKWIFDQLKQKKQQIEDDFGAELYWQRLESKQASRISFSQAFDSDDRANWPEIIEWLCSHIDKLEKACLDPLLNLKQELSSRSNETSIGQSESTKS